MHQLHPYYAPTIHLPRTAGLIRWPRENKGIFRLNFIPADQFLVKKNPNGIFLTRRTLPVLLKMLIGILFAGIKSNSLDNHRAGFFNFMGFDNEGRRQAHGIAAM